MDGRKPDLSVSQVGKTFERTVTTGVSGVAISLFRRMARSRDPRSIIRASFGESGAILWPNLIPETPSKRNWDYRFCWLRDPYFVMHADSLGMRTMEGYLSYISNIVAGTDDGYLQPVFGIAMESNLDERDYRLRATTGWGSSGRKRRLHRVRTMAMALSWRASFSTSGSRS